MRDDNNGVAKLIAIRGNRTTASVLSWLEDNIYKHLTEEEQKNTRRMILDHINGFKDLAIDIVKADTSYINEIWAEKLDEIHQELRKR
jgi:hypothetical protein